MSFFRTLSLILVGLLFCHTIVAQTTSISGKVTDDKRQNVPYASVILSNDSLAKSGISFSITDDNGEFRIEKIAAGPDARWITVRCLGYEVYRQHVSLKSVSSPLRITLRSDAQQLAELVVSDHADDVYEKGDTLIFSSKNYTLGNENNIGDVIRKMPGMEVDATGNVSYQGKKISKVLVDGNDVLASSTGISMNTLPPDFANAVELIQDYDDGDIAHDFKSGQQLALNLKSNKKLTLAGTLEGSGGLVEKFEGKASAISVMSKFSISAMVNANNTGTPVFTVQDYVSNMMDMEAIKSGGSGARTFTLSADEAALVTPPANEFARTIGLGNLNLSWTPNPRYKLRFNTLYNQGLSKGADSRTDVYLLPSGSFTNLSTSETTKETQILSQYVTQRWTPSKRFSVSANTKFDMRNFTSDYLVANHYNNTDVNAWENPRNRFAGVKQDVELKYLYGKGLLFVGADFNYGQGRGYNDIYSSECLLPISYFENINNYSYYYQLYKNDRSQTANAYVGTMYPLFKEIFIRGEVAYSIDNNNLNITHTQSTSSTESSELSAIKPHLSLMRNKGMFRFHLGAYFSNYQQDISTESTTQYRLFYVEPHAFAEFRFNSRHTISFSASDAVAPLNIQFFSRQPWADGFADLVAPSLLSNPFAKTFSAHVNYFIFNLYHSLSALIFANYQKSRESHMTNTVTDDLFTYAHYLDGGWNEQVTSQFRITKGLGVLPVDAKLSGTYLLVKQNSQQYSVEDIFQMQRLNARFDLVSRFHDFPLNAELAVRCDTYDYLFHNSGATSWSREYGGEATLHLNTGNFSFSVTGKSNRIDDDVLQRYFTDIDFALKYKFEKFELRLRGENLFHLRENEWLRESLSPTIQSSVLYRRMTGFVLGTVAFNF